MFIDLSTDLLKLWLLMRSFDLYNIWLDSFLGWEFLNLLRSILNNELFLKSIKFDVLFCPFKKYLCVDDRFFLKLFCDEYIWALSFTLFFNNNWTLSPLLKRPRFDDLDVDDWRKRFVKLPIENTYCVLLCIFFYLDWISY